MENSKIAWTDHTFSPWRGCTKVSPGCANCYAEQMSHRNPAVLGEWGRNGVRSLAAESYWRQPLRWNEAARKAGVRRRVFCASLSDVFEDRAELIQERARLFGLIQSTPNLDWLLLTKRILIRERLRELRGLEGRDSDEASGILLAGRWLDGRPPENVWLGVSAEDQENADIRIPALLGVPAVKRFVSYEPALGPVSFDRGGWLRPTYSSCQQPDSIHLTELVKGAARRTGWAGLDWIIVGGEGNGSRPFSVSWARSVIAQGRAAGVSVFVKQLGSHPINDIGTDLKAWARTPRWPEGVRFDHDARVILRDRKHGGDPAEWPEDLRVREVPS